MKAILFDFDGTLADTIPVITEGINLTMHGLGFPLHTEQEVRGFINHGARELIRRALPEFVRNDADFVEKVLVSYNKTYSDLFLHTTQAYPGIPELVATLHRSFRVGILSNKQHFLLRRLSEQILPAGSFDAVTGFDFQHPGKPDPYMTNKLLSLLGVEAKDCILVGDSDVDIQTARNAGLTHVGVSWGYRSKRDLLTAGATLVADNAEELAAIIASLT